MRILLTIPSLRPEFGGPTYKARKLATLLAARGHDVRLIGCGQADGAVGLPELGWFHGTPIPRRLAPLPKLAATADVVHAIGYRDPVGTTACLVARRAAVPYVVEPAGMHRRRLRSLRLKIAFEHAAGARILQEANAVVATSELEASELRADGVDPSTLVVRPNGIDVDELLPLPERGRFRTEHGIPADASLVLSLGRITRKKGLSRLAEAVDRMPDAWCAIVGPDDGDGALAEIQATVNRLHLRRVVIVPQGAWGADKAQVFADADAFCLPSATENFGNAPAEAAAVGMPVVLSDACGAKEFLAPKATAVVDHRDVASIAQGIAEALLPASKVAATDAAAGLRDLLDWDRIVDQQERLYASVVGGAAADRAHRVLITVPSLNPTFGGPAVEAEPLAQAIREKGFDVRLASCGPAPVGALSIPMLGAFHGTPVPARLAPLRRAVDAADTVHLLGFRDPVGTFAAWRAHRRGVPYILEPVGMYRARIRSVRAKTLFDRTLGIRVARGAAAVIATSAIEREELIDDGIPPDRIHVRPNGVDVEALLPLPERGRWRAGHGIPATAPIVLSLGRITTKKGLSHLVQAVAGLPDAWLAIVGPDEHDGSLHDVMATARRLGTIDRLCVQPQGSWGIERAQLFADADVFCLASQTENFGNAPAEAAAVGLPVVVSDRCGVADQLPSKAHQVVPYGDIDRLRDAIAEALTPAARERAASAASSVRHALSWTRIADDQVAIYRANASTSP